LNSHCSHVENEVENLMILEVIAESTPPGLIADLMPVKEEDLCGCPAIS
jgi:hypothetical protein